MAEGSRWPQGREAFDRLGSAATDPIAGLADVRIMQELLDEKGRELVVKARATDRAWAEIGTALGISKQAAWERWHDLDSTAKGA